MLDNPGIPSDFLQLKLVFMFQLFELTNFMT